MPTLLDAAGIALPEGSQVDGRSLIPLLEGREVDWEDRSIVVQAHRGNVPVRDHHMAIRNQRWKLLHPTGFGKDEPAGNVPWELYDMERDQWEKNNLAAQHPEIVRKLRAEYEAWFDRVSGTRPDNYDPPRIVLGTDHETDTVLTWQDWRVTEGGGWGKQGKWLLHFTGQHSYDVEFMWPESIDIEDVELHVGGISRTHSVGKTTDHVRLENVAVPDGDTDLWAVVRGDENTKNPYHVRLIRRH
jgi:hypothetical protein